MQCALTSETATKGWLSFKWAEHEKSLIDLCACCQSINNRNTEAMFNDIANRCMEKRGLVIVFFEMAAEGGLWSFGNNYFCLEGKLIMVPRAGLLFKRMTELLLMADDSGQNQK